MADDHPIRARNPRNNLIGQRFGKLTVVSWAGDSRWLCQCDCGGVSTPITANLKRGNTKTCGCSKRGSENKRAWKHGLYNTRAYKTWLSVRRRCFDQKNAAYKDYGAKGISMDDEWANDVVAFVRDVGQPPSDNHTLDRIDNSKGYFPENVRWATPIEQANNRSTNRYVVFRGERMTVSQLARKIAIEVGIAHETMVTALEHQMYPRRSRRRPFPTD